MKKLKEFYITFDPQNFESGIDAIAITQTPAIELTSLRFSKESPESKYTFSLDKEKRMIAGPVIIPNKKIYRRDEENGEYYVIFTEEVIEQMVDKFFSELRETIFNLEHNSKETIKGFVKGSWIIEDPDNDKSKYYGFQDLPKGTFFIEAKINDENDWERVKEMDAVGFSIEGLMGLLNNNKEQKFKQMSKKKKFVANKLSTKKMFNATTKKFEEVLVSENEDVLIVEALEVGAEVEVLTDDAKVETAEDGTYIIESEEVEVTIEEGVITEIETISEETEQEMASEEEEEEMQEETSEETNTEEEEADIMAEMMSKIAQFEARLEELEAKLAEKEEEEVMEFKAIPTGTRVSALKQLIK